MNNFKTYNTAVSLTMKDMGWQPPPVTVCRMAGFCSCKTCTSTLHGGRTASERTWTYLQRVTGGGCQFMSRMGLMRVNPDTVEFKTNGINFNETAVTIQ